MSDRRRRQHTSKNYTPKKSHQSARNSQDNSNNDGTTSTNRTTTTTPDSSSQHTKNNKLRVNSPQNHDKSSISKENTEDIENSNSANIKSSLDQILKKTKKKSKKHSQQLYSLVIIVKETSILKFNKRIHKPQVRISLYDSVSGKILTKKRTDRKKLDDSSEGFLSPHGFIANSNCFSFQWSSKNPSIAAIFDEEIDYLKITNFIIFFELIDNSIPSRSKHEDWYRIAWTFIRFIDKNEIIQIQNQILNLQLFKYQQKSLKSNTIFMEYSKRKRIQYKALLKIHFDCRQYEDQTVTAAVSLPLQSSAVVTTDDDDDNLKCQELLSKIQNRVFKIPNQNIYKEIINNGDGSSVCSFKMDSCLLAYTEIYNCNYSVIIILDFLMLQRKFELNGHEANIHSLEWMKNDVVAKSNVNGMILISTSEDQTCIIWNLLGNNYSILNVIHHTTFVYTSAILCNNYKEFNGIATGCRDGILYIWSLDFKQNVLNLKQELCNHQTFIISIQFNVYTQRLYSGDYSGLIIEWQLEDNRWIFKKNLTKVNKQKILKQFQLCSLLNRILVLTSHDLSIIDLTASANDALPHIDRFHEPERVRKPTHVGARTEDRLFGNRPVTATTTNDAATQQQTILITNFSQNEYVNNIAITQCLNYIFIGYHKKILCWCMKSKIMIQQINDFPNDCIINSIDFNTKHNLLAISTFNSSGSCNGGGIFLYGPEDFFQISNIVTNIQESSTSNQQKHKKQIRKSSSNMLLNRVLLQLDDLFNNSKKEQEIILKDQSENIDEKTFSISGNCSNNTFVIANSNEHINSINQTFSIPKINNQNENTFTIENNSSNDSTEISESLTDSSTNTTQIHQNFKGKQFQID